MLDPAALWAMFHAIREDEEKRIAMVRAETAPALDALKTLWRKFNPTEPFPSDPIQETPPEARPDVIVGTTVIEAKAPDVPLAAAVREAARRLGEFGTPEVIEYICQTYPRLEAHLRRVSVSSQLSRMAKDGQIKTVQKAGVGMAHRYGYVPGTNTNGNTKELYRGE